MKKMKLLYQKYREAIVYIFFGGCTTLVNLATYYLLRSLTNWNYNLSNVISVSFSILFAYFVNSRFVFCSNVHGLIPKMCEFLKFVSARLITMLLEVGGVWVMVDFLSISDKLSKLVIQFIVLVLNYIFSKLLVFRPGKEDMQK